ncbi:DUF2510 domain-containing protein [Mycolicibacterium llatzerense]|uniref:DUF2510 domain-containing protein n=1 Tax=Mycolicibacterium llatzerense TaxID=280871 RepID=UPI003CD0B95C
MLDGGGWSPDPTGTGGLRWWNGTSWTADLYPTPSATPSTQAHPATPPVTLSRVRGRARVIAALIALCGAVVAVAIFALPKAWHLATEPSRVAGREYAARWVAGERSAGRMSNLSKADIEDRCISEANRAASQGVQLENGTRLSPGRIMRAEFRNACIEAALQRLTVGV